ncbi:FkbM family methyltransferase [Chryseobacterium jejuense]|uniref:Methyltransferase, FkbM family n=1 Tax=Chryseobacterium jejuense TaxID=445960 RepID=A0A2X2VCM2_CHRJE|nr:FkbM family methyltransferase [Chryseobacterium jejuense]SDJ72881.1 methyltransferase, FkbM family [Chryseobacterium jejuense]SQB26434.1 methyltransferase, FkbM family [Chryseobacterium jejuense]
MRSLLASFFKIILSIPFFRQKYFTFHKYIFNPYHPFDGVKKNIVYRGSIQLNLDLGDWIQQQLYFVGDYEKNEIDYLYSVLQDGDTFIDIGGNIGIFSLNASQIVGKEGKVYAFEAFKPNYEKFSQHLSINHFNNVTLEHQAVSDNNNYIEILYNESYGNVGMASSYLENFTAKEKVKSIILDDYVKNQQLVKIDLIKIDIEGGEFSALQGMQEILTHYQPKIIIEINNIALKNSDHSEEELIRLLLDKGYSQTKVLSRNENSYNAVFECL